VTTKIQVKKVDDQYQLANMHRVTITYDDGEKKDRFVGTNQSGNGLWIDGKQVRGTMDFNLHCKNKSQKIRRYFARNYA
jgi:hypothetical protein